MTKGDKTGTSISTRLTMETVDNPRPCIVCDTPTDHKLALDGGTEWFVACMMAMDMPAKEAKALVIYLTNTTSNFGTSAKLYATVKPWAPRVAPERVHVFIVCPSCAAKANFQSAAGDTAPCYRQPAV